MSENPFRRSVEDVRAERSKAKKAEIESDDSYIPEAPEPVEYRPDPEPITDEYTGLPDRPAPPA